MTPPRGPGRRRHPVASVLVIVVCAGIALLVFDATSNPAPGAVPHAVGVAFAVLVLVALAGVVGILVRSRRDR